MSTDPFERAALREIEGRRHRKRRGVLNGFMMHLVVYLGVNMMLFAIWWFAGRGFPWVVFSAVGWGIGVLAHALATRGALARIDRGSRASGAV